jgi:predicted transcriptional regulator
MGGRQSLNCELIYVNGVMHRGHLKQYSELSNQIISDKVNIPYSAVSKIVSRIHTDVKNSMTKQKKLKSLIHNSRFDPIAISDKVNIPYSAVSKIVSRIHTDVKNSMTKQKKLKSLIHNSRFDPIAIYSAVSKIISRIHTDVKNSMTKQKKLKSLIHKV